jgi:hypothetical protein
MQDFILQFLDQLFLGGFISFCKLYYFLFVEQLWCVQCVFSLNRSMLR